MFEYCQSHNFMNTFKPSMTSKNKNVTQTVFSMKCFCKCLKSRSFCKQVYVVFVRNLTLKTESSFKNLQKVVELLEAFNDGKNTNVSCITSGLQSARRSPNIEVLRDLYLTAVVILGNSIAYS